MPRFSVIVGVRVERRGARSVEKVICGGEGALGGRERSRRGGSSG